MSYGFPHESSHDARSCTLTSPDALRFHTSLNLRVGALDSSSYLYAKIDCSLPKSAIPPRPLHISFVIGVIGVICTSLRCVAGF